MLRAFYSSATGMRAQEILIDNTANNLANVNTNGFKRQHVDFADLLYSTEKEPGAEVASGQPAPIGLQIGSGVRVMGTTKVFSPGTPEETGITTDVLIEGDGFFQVEMPAGELRYTRDGSFRVDGQSGRLLTSDGYVVSGGVTVPTGVSSKSISIGVDGLVQARSADGGSQTLGTIPLYMFRNPAGLSSEGGNMYRETPASGTVETGVVGTNVGTMRQGYVERSNVEVVRELVSLITAQRAYEINSRAIQAGDEMLSTTAQLVR